MEGTMVVNETLSGIRMVQNNIYEFLKYLINEFDETYKNEAEAIINTWVEESNNVVQYAVDDKIAKSVEEKLKHSGIPYLILDCNNTLKHVVIVPDLYTQQLESAAILTAKEYDRISEVKVSALNDLCYAEMMQNYSVSAKRYELRVENKHMVNRLREALTKDNNNKIPFAIEKQEDGSAIFYCTSTDTEKLNRAFFETAWNFAGQFSELNEKQEALDLKQQNDLTERMNQSGHYYIIDPVLDEQGKPTGQIKEMIEVTDEEIKLYKDGKNITTVIEHNDTEESHDTFVSWTDRQSRPIIVEENEIGHLKETLIQKNPEILLEQKDYEQFKEDKKAMFLAEKELEMCFKKEMNENSKQAILEYIAQYDKVKNDQALYTEKEKTFVEIYNAANPQTYEIESKDLTDIDRIISYAQERIQEKEISVDKTRSISQER